MTDQLDKVEEKEVEQPETKQTEEPKYTETEAEALATGWVPKDQWKGAEEDWVPAKAYLKYGQVESDLKRVRSEASQKEKVIKSMKDYYLNVKEDAKKEILDTLKRHKREAIKNEDYAEVAKLDVQIDEINDNLDRKFKASDEKVKNIEVPQGPPPEFFDWNRKNSWYVLGAQDGLTKEADALAIGYAQAYPAAKYDDVLNYVEETIKAKYPQKFEKPRGRPTDVNEPGESVGDAKPKTKVKLTPAERQAAEAFGMTPEEYAAGLQKWESTRGQV